MAKTNHQRGFKGKRHVMLHGSGDIRKISKLSDVMTYAWWHPSPPMNGRASAAKGKAGAKKHLRATVRFHENQAIRKLVEDL